MPATSNTKTTASAMVARSHPVAAGPPFLCVTESFPCPRTPDNALGLRPSGPSGRGFSLPRGARARARWGVAVGPRLKIGPSDSVDGYQHAPHPYRLEQGEPFTEEHGRGGQRDHGDEKEIGADLGRRGPVEQGEPDRIPYGGPGQPQP